MLENDDFLSEADKALLEREFDTADPRAIDNIIDRISPYVLDQEMPKILFRYDATPPGGRNAGNSPHLECAFEHPQKHWNGYIVEFEDGTRAQVGKDCAIKHFNADFQKVENAFLADVDRKTDLQRLVSLRNFLPSAIAELKQLDQTRPIQAFRGYWKKFTREFTALMHALVGLDQSRLIVTKRTRDRAAEEREARRYEPDLYAKTQRTDDAHLQRRAVIRWRKFVEGGAPIWRRQNIDLGPCDAYHLLRRRHELEKLLGEAITLGDAEKDAILNSRSFDWNRRKLTESERAVKDMLSKVDGVLALIDDLKAFAEASNIQRIAAWAREQGEFDESSGAALAVEGAVLVHTGTGERLELPIDFAAPPTPSLDMLRRVLGVPPRKLAGPVSHG